MMNALIYFLRKNVFLFSVFFVFTSVVLTSLVNYVNLTLVQQYNHRIDGFLIGGLLGVTLKIYGLSYSLKVILDYNKKEIAFKNVLLSVCFFMFLPMIIGPLFVVIFQNTLVSPYLPYIIPFLYFPGIVYLFRLFIRGLKIPFIKTVFILLYALVMVMLVYLTMAGMRFQI